LSKKVGESRTIQFAEKSHSEIFQVRQGLRRLFFQWPVYLCRWHGKSNEKEEKSMAVCKCTGEQVDLPQDLQLMELLGHYRGYDGALIPVLQGAQDIYGYLPAEVLERISDELKLPFSEVFGVVTFYSQFHLKPRGRNIIRVCLGTACHVRGGSKIFNSLKDILGVDNGGTTDDLRYTLESVACIGACGLAPCIMINDDTHGRLTTDGLDTILEQYE
jgi:NADH-quinone oxidoreductase subunit E